MYCREVRAFISLYLDYQLNTPASHALEEHVASCAACRKMLDLMHEIPVALQTERRMAPRHEFTKLVMQQIIVRQQIGQVSSEAHYTRVSFQTGSGGPFRHELEAANEPEQEDLEETPTPVETAPGEAGPGDDQSAKIVSLNQYRTRRTNTPADYVLRFSSLAAAVVMMVGVGIYVYAQASGQTPAVAAAVYGSISSFAETLRAALSSPLEVVAGVGIAAIVLIAFWYLVRTMRTSNDPEAGRRA